MANTFFGLTIGASGLYASNISINTTAHNIANADTEGYSRQKAIYQAANALKVNAPYGMAGQGVELQCVQQIRDSYYDVKYRESNAKLGEYKIENAVTMENLVNAEDPGAFLLPIDSLFASYPAVTLTEKQTLRCRNGNAFSVTPEPGTYRAYSPEGEFLMLAKVEDGVMSTIKSFFSV